MKIAVLSMHNNSRDWSEARTHFLADGKPLVKIVRRQQKRRVEHREKLDETQNWKVGVTGYYLYWYKRASQGKETRGWGKSYLGEAEVLINICKLVQHVMKHYNFVYIFQMTIACSWIFGLVITFPMFLARNFDKELDWCVYTWSEEWMGKAYSMVWFLFTGFFPVTFMIALYSQVVYTMWFTRSKPRGRQHCVQQVRN